MECAAILRVVPLARQPWFAGVLLLSSGLAALVYQVTWFREFRLMFGNSTYATAAVLAIFMAGLGAGSALLGRVADRRLAPLAWYGVLELGIALSAAVSPLLLLLARQAYIALGGAVSLGLPLATLIRLLLAVLVLGIPTFLMGGTLPAAARAVETPGDRNRRHMALLYGLNTLGAVGGVLLATFVLLETYGNRKTLFLAVLLNVVVAIVAIAAGNRARPVPGDLPEEDMLQPASIPESGAGERTATPILLAAAAVGFVFFLMELVWYRMLAPLLGGTTFTFGLILAMALLGIGLGGAAYAFWSGSERRPSAGTFALTCSVEALAIAIPFALGDRLAIFANQLRSLATVGFVGDVLGWSIVTAVVVLPAAFISGLQFPILVALLGEGRAHVGRHVGAAYAWNTAGAIAGAIAGGFGLLPLLSAPGAWRLAAIVLVVVGLVAAIGGFTRRAYVSAGAAVIVGLLALGSIAAHGPTAVWRHTGIGAGRAPHFESMNDIREWMHAARRTLVWEADGRESSIAVSDHDDRNFTVNGKVDGSARGDDSTQVMSGLLGAILHPDPRMALVIGLGTGSTAGWLAGVESLERVDVVELEPAVVRVARDFAAVNNGGMTNPKVRVHLNDAREVLLTTRERYDIVFSEPSNPYRAGIASLYTREFYEAAARRLRAGGLFVQWVQTYEVDAETIRTIYATITSVFGHVNTWRTTPADLILIASLQPQALDVERVRRRLTESPYQEATHNTWRVETAEGVLAHFIGNDSLARTVGSGHRLNTDDRTLIEFGFARSLGSDVGFDVNELMHAARALGADRPKNVTGEVDWDVVELNKWTYPALELPPGGVSDLVRARHEFTRLYEDDDLIAALEAWRRLPWGPVSSLEVSRLAEAFAEDGSEQAEVYLALLRDLQPVEALAIEARLHLNRGNLEEAARLVALALDGLTRDPWPQPDVMRRALHTAATVAGTDRTLAAQMLRATERPFVAGQWEDQRRRQRVHIAWGSELGCGPNTTAALRALEPHVPWNEQHLRLRRQCYARAGLDELHRRASADWEAFQKFKAQPLIERK